MSPESEQSSGSRRDPAETGVHILTTSPQINVHVFLPRAVESGGSTDVNPAIGDGFIVSLSCSRHSIHSMPRKSYTNGYDMPLVSSPVQKASFVPVRIYRLWWMIMLTYQLTLLTSTTTKASRRGKGRSRLILISRAHKLLLMFTPNGGINSATTSQCGIVSDAS